MGKQMFNLGLNELGLVLWDFCFKSKDLNMIQMIQWSSQCDAGCFLSHQFVHDM